MNSIAHSIASDSIQFNFFVQAIPCSIARSTLHSVARQIARSVTSSIAHLVYNTHDIRLSVHGLFHSSHHVSGASQDSFACNTVSSSAHIDARSCLVCFTAHSIARFMVSLLESFTSLSVHCLLHRLPTSHNSCRSIGTAAPASSLIAYSIVAFVTRSIFLAP